ncbi:MAG: LPS assembly protein LptD [Gammaproteobacteria bacterium]|nr:LPS assembly protein LptD [Gammaproteobacteria bacterium]
MLTADIDQGIDWGACRVAEAGRGLALPKTAKLAQGGPIEITADAAMTEFEPQRALFSGDVLLTQDDVRLQAGSISLDRSTGEIEANQGFMFTRPDIRFAGSKGRYQTATREAQVEQASYRIPAIRARGDAEYAAFLGNGVSRFDNISYTTCAPGDTSWVLHADELELDQNEGFGTAKHAKLRFLGVPMLYAPRFTFPIDDRRRSGVLVPSVGYSENTGADVSVPYYFNLAENYDLTLTPRVMSKRGLMLSSEFRFLTSHTSGTLAADLLPDDRERDTGDNTRGAASLYTRSRFSERTHARLRLNYVSDSEYFEDLGGDLAATSATHLERAGEITYDGDDWRLFGQAQYFQTIDDAIAKEDRAYSQLPLIRFDLERPDGIGGVTYHLGAEYANFHRDDSVRGHRVALAPALSLPLGDSWWFVEPKAGAHYTGYSLTDQVAGRDDAPSHLTGMISLDSGLYFDRAASYFGRAATHTLEPRAYYLYVPSSEQNDQPLFDTSELDFRFDNLFRDNRFNGPDRVGDANQVTLALTSRVNDGGSGEELLRTSIGQIYYVADRDVTLPGEPEDDDSSSAVIGELAARLGRGWRTRAGLQWDPHDGDDGTIDQALAQLSYRSEGRQVFNAAYRLRDGIARQTDVAFFWPVNEQFTLIGRHNYSLRDSRLLEALAGFEYGKCCWRVRAVARKYVDGDGDDHNLAFLLQLELRGLGRLGDDVDKTLERGIYGYRLDDDD